MQIIKKAEFLKNILIKKENNIKPCIIQEEENLLIQQKTIEIENKIQREKILAFKKEKKEVVKIRQINKIPEFAKIIKLSLSKKIENMLELEKMEKKEFKNKIIKNEKNIENEENFKVQKIIQFKKEEKIVEIKKEEKRDFRTLEEMIEKDNNTENDKISLSKKLKLFFKKDINLFRTENTFENRLFQILKKKLEKEKSTEQKLKYIFLKIYQNFEILLLKKIHNNKKKTEKGNLMNLKLNSKEFKIFFNWIFFDNEKLKNSLFRIYNPKNKNLSFNFKFIKKIFQNQFFLNETKKFLDSAKFHDFILIDIDAKIEMIINLVKIYRFKPEEIFFKHFYKKVSNKIPWKISQIYTARKFFLDKL